MDAVALLDGQRDRRVIRPHRRGASFESGLDPQTTMVVIDVHPTRLHARRHLDARGLRRLGLHVRSPVSWVDAHLNRRAEFAAH